MEVLEFTVDSPSVYALLSVILTPTLGLLLVPILLITSTAAIPRIFGDLTRPFFFGTTEASTPKPYRSEIPAFFASIIFLSAGIAGGIQFFDHTHTYQSQVDKVAEAFEEKAGKEMTGDAVWLTASTGMATGYEVANSQVYILDREDDKVVIKSAPLQDEDNVSLMEPLKFQFEPVTREKSE